MFYVSSNFTIIFLELFKDQLRKTVSFSGGETVREIQFDPAEFEEIPLRAQ